MTRSSAAERAQIVHVESYDIGLDLTSGEELLGSTSVIRFSCLRPGADSYAELQADTVHEITLNGRRLEPERVCSDGRITLADLGSSNELRVTAQLLAATAVTSGQLDLLAGLLDGTAEVPGLAVDAELRWALLQRLASTGRADDARIGAELNLDPSEQGSRRALACRAAIPDAEHKAEAWWLLTGSDELGAEDLMAVAPAFSQGDHAPLLAPYTAEYFARMPAFWASHTRLCALRPRQGAVPLHRGVTRAAQPDR